MIKKGKHYNATGEERAIIKEMIDKKYGKITNTVDYPTGSKLNYGLSYEMKKGGFLISGATLKRLVGLTELRAIHYEKLLSVAGYLGFNNIDMFLNEVEIQLKRQKIEVKVFNRDVIFDNHMLCIDYGKNKVIHLRSVSKVQYEIVFSKRSILKLKDMVIIEQLEIDLQLIFKEVLRKIEKNTTNLGSFYSSADTVKSISFVKS